METGDTESTIKHAQQGWEYGEKSRSVAAMGNASWALGVGYTYSSMRPGNQPLQNLAKAKEYFEKSLSIYLENGFVYQAWNTEFWTAQTHIGLGNFETALEIIETILSKFVSISNKFREAACRAQLAKVFVGLSQHQKALYEIKTAIEILTAFEMRPAVARCNFILASVYGSMGLKDEAIMSNNLAEKMFTEMEMGFWAKRARSFSELLR